MKERMKWMNEEWIKEWMNDEWMNEWCNVVYDCIMTFIYHTHWDNNKLFLLLQSTQN